MKCTAELITDVNIKLINGTKFFFEKAKEISFNIYGDKPLREKEFRIYGNGFDLTITNVETFEFKMSGKHYEGNKELGCFIIKNSL